MTLSRVLILEGGTLSSNVGFQFDKDSGILQLGQLQLSTPLAVAYGGTGLNTLPANNVLLGNGTGNVQAVAPSTSGNILTSNGTSWVSAPVPAGGSVTSVGLDIDNTTGLTFTESGSPVTTSGTITVATGGTLTVGYGGTGLSSFVSGDIIYASGTTTLTALAAAAAGNVLLSGTSPSWGKVDLTSAITGVLPAANGGTGVANSSTITLGGNVTTQGSLTLAGAFSTTLTVTANTDVTLPTTGTLATTSNKLSDFASTTSAELASVISDETGTGFLVFNNGPTLVAPNIGTATGTSLALTSATADTLSATSTTSATTGIRSVISLKAQSSGASADGFGPAIKFQLRDSDAVDNIVAYVSAERDGADNSGALVFYTASAGTVAEAARLTAGGVLELTSALGATEGGTGLSSYTQYGILYASASNSLAELAPGTSGRLLKTNDSASAPEWVSQADLAVGSAALADNLALSGTNQIVYQSGAFTTSLISAPTTASTFLEWNGSAFVWSSISSGGVLSVSGGSTGLTFTGTSNLTMGGTLEVGSGGTGGTATPTAGAVPYGTGTAYDFNSAGTAGQVLVSGGTGAPTFEAALSVSGSIATVSGQVDASGSEAGGALIARGSTTSSSTYIQAATLGAITSAVSVSNGFGSYISFDQKFSGSGVTNVYATIGAQRANNDNDTGDLVFQTNNNGTLTEVLRFGYLNDRDVAKFAGNIWVTDGTAGSPAIAFSSDTNTGFYLQTADNLALATSGSHRMTVTNSGRFAFGSGNTSPSYTFDFKAATVGVGSNAFYRLWTTTTTVNELLRIQGGGGATTPIKAATFHFSQSIAGSESGNISMTSSGISLESTGSLSLKAGAQTLTIDSSTGAVTLPAALSAANGGTGISSYTAGDVLYASDSTTLSNLAIGSAGEVLTVGAGGVPEWGTVASVGTADNISGGSANQILYQSATGTTAFADAPTTGSTFLEWSGTAFQWSAIPSAPVTSVAGKTGVVTLDVADVSGAAATADGLDQFAATTSAELASVISDETGSGALVFATSPTLVTPNLGAASATSLTLTNALAIAQGGTGATTEADARTNLGLGTAATKDVSAANGVASLDGSGKVPTSELPAAVIGGVTYQGSWNADTNSPTLTGSTGTKGYYYVVSTAGSTDLDGITDWQVGDWAIFNGSVWEKVDNTDGVTSVAGKTGVVTLTVSDVTGAAATSGSLAQFAATTSLQLRSVITDETGTGSLVFANNPSMGIVSAQGLTLTTALDEVYGGTGQSSYTSGDILYASGLNNLGKLGIGTSSFILTSSGSAPQWSDPSGISVGSAGTATSADQATVASTVSVGTSSTEDYLALVNATGDTQVLTNTNVTLTTTGILKPKALLIQSSSLTPSIVTTQDTSATAAVTEVTRLGAKSTGTAASGFGARLTFRHDDSSASPYDVGAIETAQTGAAIDTASLNLYASSGGSLARVATFSPDKSVLFEGVTSVAYGSAGASTSSVVISKTLSNTTYGGNSYVLEIGTGTSGGTATAGFGGSIDFFNNTANAGQIKFEQVASDSDTNDIVISTSNLGTVAETARFTADNKLQLQNALEPAYGGTGISSYTAGQILYANGSTSIATLNIGTSGQVLTSDGSAPYWSTVSAGGQVDTVSGGTTGLVFSGTTDLTMSGTLDEANGGTGQSSYSVGNILYASGSTTLSKLAIGTSGRILRSTGAAPIWSLPDDITVGNATAAATVATSAATTTGYLVQVDTSGTATQALRNNANVTITDIGGMSATTLALASSSSSPLTVTRNVVAATGVQLVATFKLSSAVSGSSGLASAADFVVRDSSATDNTIARIAGMRTTADSTGDIVFYTSNLGTLSEAGRFNSSNQLILQNALDEIYGGTGQSTYTTGDLLYASASNTLSTLSIGTSDYVMTSTGSAPSWSNVLRMGDGSVSAPSYSFSSDTDTGIYYSSAPSLEFALAGSRYLSLTDDYLRLYNQNTGSSVTAVPAYMQVVLYDEATGGFQILDNEASTTQYLEILYQTGGAVDGLINMNGVNMLTLDSSNNNANISAGGDTGVRGIFFATAKTTSTAAAGCYGMESYNGTNYYVWTDLTGDLRIWTQAPSSTSDTSGTVVGTQSFTGAHFYPTDAIVDPAADDGTSMYLEVGDAVRLVNGKIVRSTAPNQKDVVGIFMGMTNAYKNSLTNEGSTPPVYGEVEVPVLDDEGNQIIRPDGTPKTKLEKQIVQGEVPLWLAAVASVGDNRDFSISQDGLRGFSVCDENGAIEPGDYLVSSSTPGYLMKQSDDLMRSCTVGKALESVTFDSNGKATGVYGYIYCG